MCERSVAERSTRGGTKRSAELTGTPDVDPERALRIQADLDSINECLDILRANPELLSALKNELENADVLVDLAKSAGINLGLPYDVARELLSEHALKTLVTQRRPLTRKRVSPETQEKIRIRDRELAATVRQKTARHREIASELGVSESTVRNYVDR
jgi:DNA-binding NarL/FixJ family response regulator